MANNSNNEVISKAGNAVMATHGVKITGDPDPIGPPINPSNKMAFQVKNFCTPLGLHLLWGLLALSLYLRDNSTVMPEGEKHWEGQ